MPLQPITAASCNLPKAAAVRLASPAGTGGRHAALVIDHPRRRHVADDLDWPWAPKRRRIRASLECRGASAASARGRRAAEHGGDASQQATSGDMRKPPNGRGGQQAEGASAAAPARRIRWNTPTKKSRCCNSSPNGARSLELKSRQLDEREAMVAAAEQRMDQKMAELKALQSTVEDLLKKRSDEEEQRLQTPGANL